MYYVLLHVKFRELLGGGKIGDEETGGGAEVVVLIRHRLSFC